MLARRSQDQVGDLATMVEESVLGIRILKAFGRSGYLSRRFLVQARELRATEMSKARVISKLWAVIIALPEIAFGLTLFLGLQQVADGELSAGTLVAFFGVALGLRWPIDSIGWLLAMSNDAASATQRFFEVMDAPITVTSPEHAAGRRRRPPAAGWSSPASRFRFADTPPTADDLLRGIDLDIAPGETVALVGATGSGKTTLTSLINRLYDVTGGSISLDGVDIRDLDLAELRGQVSVAFEEPTLFSASVRENVLLGRPDGTDDDVHPGAAGRPGGLRHGPAVGPGHPDRRAGPVAVRRATATAGPGPGRRRSAGRAGARRSAVRAGHPHRGPGGAGAAVGAGRTPPPSSSRTARRPCNWPTGWRCWSTAGSPRSAPTRS